jgi:hypothetical protein
MVCFGLASCLSGNESRSGEVRTVVKHDTVYAGIDTIFVTQRDTVFYDSKWLRRLFETTKWKVFRNYGDEYEVEYPEFMEKVELMQGERHMRREFHGITLQTSAYNDKREMSVKEKYEAINMSAVTKSIADSSFLLAGRQGDHRLFFEKDVKLKNHAWMYLRVEFPAELTWAVDPLLQYVKDYNPEERRYVVEE